MKPIEMRREKLIVVPADVLWQMIEPAEALPSWFPMCDRCERISGDALGRRQRMHARWGGKAAEIDAEVVEHVPGRRLAWRHIAERVDGKPAPTISSDVRVSVELHSEGAVTRVVIVSRNVPAAWWAAPLVRLFAAPRIRKAMERGLKQLARIGD